MPSRRRPWPWRLLRATLIWALGLVLLFEEWGWEPLARTLARIGRWPGLRWIEAFVKGLPPYGALALFLVPMLALLPIKILALYWLSHGHQWLGVSTILVAKVGGTALTARLFMLTQPTLMRLAWFARWFQHWMVLKARVLAHVRQSRTWQQWLQTRQAVRGWASTALARARQAWQRWTGRP